MDADVKTSDSNYHVIGVIGGDVTPGWDGRKV